MPATKARLTARWAPALAGVAFASTFFLSR
jgi:hypothetical protein